VFEGPSNVRLLSLGRLRSRKTRTQVSIHRRRRRHSSCRNKEGARPYVEFRSEHSDATLVALSGDWWMQYGVETPELKMFALKNLGLCRSSSGCERNWSTFEFIHTKKRNRLEGKRLNDLVYVQYNRRLHERFQERKKHPEKYDPICLEDLDWGSSWMTKHCEDLVHEGDDLTWAIVDEAIGASKERTRRGKMSIRGSTSQGIRNDDEDEDDMMSEEEEETDDDDVPWESNNEDGDKDDEVEGDSNDDGGMALQNAMFGFKL
ncbi:hypothetical protein Taro_005187, partial [Colocasia esculenta]|nr:hypothetical protein [Colocasia esculenta]